MAVRNGWLVIITKPNQEGIALSQLAVQDYDAWLPLCYAERRRVRKIVKVKAPLFPGYVFTRYEDGVTDVGPIVTTRGISRIIASRDGKPAVLEDEVINEIRKRMTEDGGTVVPVDATRTIWEKDQIIAIIEGPLAGYAGLFVSNEGDRVTLLLNILGRQQAIPMPISAVIPANS